MVFGWRLEGNFCVIFFGVLHWSPTEADVFASCFVDGTLQIWNIRSRWSSAISSKAQNVVISVISWNRYEFELPLLGSSWGLWGCLCWHLQKIQEETSEVNFIELCTFKNRCCDYSCSCGKGGKIQIGSSWKTASVKWFHVTLSSGNRLASCFIASGCDDGAFRIWDLRNLKVLTVFVLQGSYDLQISFRTSFLEIRRELMGSSFLLCTLNLSIARGCIHGSFQVPYASHNIYCVQPSWVVHICYYLARSRIHVCL